MFLAKVIVGKSIFLEPDKSLKSPPIDPSSKRPYDSVEGST